MLRRTVWRGLRCLSVGLVSRTKFSLSALATAHRHPRRTEEIINFPSRNGRPLVRAFSGAAFDKSFFSKFAVKRLCCLRVVCINETEIPRIALLNHMGAGASLEDLENGRFPGGGFPGGGFPGGGFPGGGFANG